MTIKKIVPYIALATLIILGAYYYISNKKQETQEVGMSMVGDFKIADDQENTNDNEIKPEPSVATDTFNLKQTKFFNNKVEILLPENFQVMDDTMAKFKYPSENRPEIIYTNSDSNINIALSRVNTLASETDLPEFSRLFGDMFESAKDFQSNEIITINDKKFVVIKMITGAVDTDIFNLMAIGILDGKLFIVTFNCTIEEMNTWKPIGEKIINSIKITS